MDANIFILLVASAAGLIGAGARALIGIQKSKAESTKDSPYKFDGVAVIIDLIIGAICGAAAGIFGLAGGPLTWIQASIAAFGAGVAGPDFVGSLGQIKK